MSRTKLASLATVLAVLTAPGAATAQTDTDGAWGAMRLNLGRPQWDISGATVWDEVNWAGRWTGRHAKAKAATAPAPVATDALFQTIAMTSTAPARTGRAAAYGAEFDGRLTATGERFDMYRLTAASADLPLNAYVAVRNPATGEQVVVRINDRRPNAGGAMIVLSSAAANRLRLEDAPGSVVEMRYLGLTPPASPAPMQVAAR